MSIQFIIGRSGTGKSRWCLNAVNSALTEDGPDGRSLVLLVPEQATYRAERAVLSARGVQGYHRLNILSFDRLGMLLCGRTAARSLSRIGQQMIVHRLLVEARDKLKIFGSCAGGIGLGRELALMISEFHEYGKTPADIELLADRLAAGTGDATTALKFADMAHILRRYVDFISGRLVSPDIQLDRVLRAVADSPVIGGATVWVDGFSGFTTAEERILAEILKAADEVFVTLCLDMDAIGPDIPAPLADLFGPTRRTYRRLGDIARSLCVPIKKPLVLRVPKRFAHSPELTHLQANIFVPGAPKLAAGADIRIIGAPDARREAEFVARQIRLLVRNEQIRYRDIAVIASDMDRYEHYIRACFEDYRIPHFLDRQRPLGHHPVARFVCSALKAAVGGFATGDVMSYLKTDLAGLDRHEADLLDNYCRAFGIDGQDWTAGGNWQFADPAEKFFDQDRIDRLRRRAVEPLNRLGESLGGDGRGHINATQFASAVRQFLESGQVIDKLLQWSRSQLDPAACVHAQFYSRMADLLDEVVVAFEGRPMGRGRFVEVFSFAISQLKLAFIPPSLDQVTVGTIQRSRHGELKAVFLIGVNQGLFPCPVGSAAILTDQDRTLAEAAGFELAGTVVQRLADRRYLAYIAFTRSSGKLYICYTMSDDKDRPVVASPFVGEVELLFEQMPRESRDRPERIEDITTAGELTDMLCLQLGRDFSGDQQGGPVERLPEKLLHDPQTADVARIVLNAVKYDNAAKLDAETSRNLYCGSLTCSATRLSTFASCPYRHFARYALRLAPRRQFRLEPLDLGLFYHKAMDKFIGTFAAEGWPPADSGEEQVRQAMARVVSEIRRTDPFISNFVRHGGYNAFVVSSAARTLADLAVDMARIASAGSLKPFASEVQFGPDCRLGRWEMPIEGGGTLSMTGKIDRIDVAQVDGRKVAVVFDYKLRQRRFSWSKLHHGLDLQLPVYMLAVRDGQGGVCSGFQPIGGFYLPVEVLPQKSDPEEDDYGPGDTSDRKAMGIFDGRFFDVLDSGAAGWSSYYNFCVTGKNQQYSNYPNSGVLTSEHFERLLDIALGRIVELAAGIAAGKIEVRPYRLNSEGPCEHCDYRPVCRFDWRINERNVLSPTGKAGTLDGSNA